MEPDLRRGPAKQGSRRVQLLRHLLVRLLVALKVSGVKRLGILGLLLLVQLMVLGLLLLMLLLILLILLLLLVLLLLLLRLLLILLLPRRVGHLDLQAHVSGPGSGCFLSEG